VPNHVVGGVADGRDPEATFGIRCLEKLATVRLIFVHGLSAWP
jgi:hypothetical protein